MARMLANADEKLFWVPSIANPNTPRPSEVAESVTGNVDLSCLASKANFQLGLTGNDSISDPALCSAGTDEAPGNATYEATIDFYRGTTVGDDKAWTTFTGRGIAGFLVHRIGKPYAQAWADQDPVGVYGVLTGDPQPLMADAQGGFRKFRVKFFVQGSITNPRTRIQLAD